MKKLLLLLILCGVSLVAIAKWISNSRGQQAHEDDFIRQKIEYGSVMESVSAPGVVVPRDIVVVGPNGQSGTVVEIMCEANQEVVEGQELLKMDDRGAKRKAQQAKTAVVIAEDNVRLAEKNVARAQAVRDARRYEVDKLSKLDRDVLIQKQLEAAQFALQEAEASVEAALEAVKVAQGNVAQAQEAAKLADLGLQMTTIVVPSVKRSWDKGPTADQRAYVKGEPGTAAHPAVDNGPQPGSNQTSPAGLTSEDKPRRYTVLERNVELGQEISPLNPVPLFKLAAGLDRMQVYAQVAESDIGKVKIGQLVDFTVSAHSESDLHFEGKVSKIPLLPVADHGAVFYRVIIDVDNRRDPATGDWLLRPKMSASVDIIRQRRDKTWKVPAAAVNLHMDEQHQTAAAKAKLAEWQKRTDRHLWRPVWVLSEDKKPWPIFVRIEGKNAQGQPAIHDTQTFEVLEWDPDLKPLPNPNVKSTYLQVITATPPPRKGGLFNLPSFKF